MDDGLPGLNGQSCQARFQQRWPELRDPHVRALAWLLDSPDLMDPAAACWGGRIASLGAAAEQAADWLRALEREPAALHLHLQQQPSARLGRYAEQLLGFYLRAQGQLVAANLQVRNIGPTRETLGEFDFLVRRPALGNILEHWEFATKFYLLEATQHPGHLPQDAFVGPNLADSLGRKMRKIMDQQLLLSAHPAAGAVLPAPVQRTGALVKGWLFYHVGAPSSLLASGIAADHCRGFWCELHDLAARWGHGDHRFVLLPRLARLAPWREAASGMTLAQMAEVLAARLAQEDAPQLLAVCRPSAEGDEIIEVARGFVVPSDWQARAASEWRHAVQPV